MQKEEMVKENNNKALKVLIIYIAIVIIAWIIGLAFIVSCGGIKGFT
ncbi:hypothetical protein HMPREF1860_00089 [Prevotella amnii]|uniref:Uncharacterized protein n=2 Tax=Prevotella amnii TaxID=419005 RepID=A0A134BP81_9BACT|nr:hypothetical protein HMPREF1860_00089 [Prevotella amnii]